MTDSENFESLFSPSDLDTDVFDVITTGEDIPPEDAFKLGQQAIAEIAGVPKEDFKTSIKKIVGSDTAIQTVMNKVQTKFMPGDEINDYQEDFFRTFGEGLTEVIPPETTKNVKVVLANQAHTNWLNEVEAAMKAADEKSVLFVVFGKEPHGLEMFRTGIQIKNRVMTNPGWEVIKEASEAQQDTKVGNEMLKTAVSRVMCLVRP